MSNTNNENQAQKEPVQKKPPLAEQVNPDIVNQLVNGGANAKPATPQKTNSQETKQKQHTTKPAPNKSTPNKPVNKPAANKPATNKPAAQKPTNKPVAHKPAPKPNTGNVTKPNAPKPTTNRPAPNKSVATKPVAGKAPVKTVAADGTKKAVRPKNNNPNRRNSGPRGTLKIVPIGGLGEIGKNMTYYEYGNDAFIVDCGLAFPDESMLGVDIVIPDFTYIIENQKKIKGLFVTHGHEDHIGAISYLLKNINIPIYATRLTIGLIEGKLKEHNLLKTAKLNIVKAGDTVRAGVFGVEFINVNHSIPDACAFAIHTPIGVVIQTGDFKIDFTPIAGDVMNLARFGELGSKGVLALLSDSTNAERPGFAESERVVGDGLNKLFADAKDKRILIATFASNVHRVQQIMDSAIKFGRKVAISGRSMENVSTKALELGYLKAPKDLLVDIDQAESMPPERVAIITTGSQGEPMSALTRMARGDHRTIRVTPEDCIIFSANPIPGNEKAVTKVVNDLLMLGADVAYDKQYKLHVSGHANQDELKMILALVKPKYFIPVHGEYKHLQRHGEIAQMMGIPKSNIHVGENGQVIEFDRRGMHQKNVVTTGAVMVDGLGIGDVGSIVLRDRKHLAEDGLIVVITTIQRKDGKIVAGPDIVSRGFVYVKESEDMMAKARTIARNAIENCVKKGSREWGILKNQVRDDVGDYVWQMTKRRPMILPVIQEVDTQA